MLHFYISTLYGYVGDVEGTLLGPEEGLDDSKELGWTLGSAHGLLDGDLLGCTLGSADGWVEHLAAQKR